MNRRSVLLLVATLVAILGTALVAVYVRNADSRAQQKFDTVEVLRATQIIEPGEAIEAASSGGKIDLQPVPQNQVLDGAMQTTDTLAGKVAVTRIFPGEQIIPGKFGGQAESASLAIPKGMQAMSVNLTDAARVSGFVSPGSEVAIYHVQPMDSSGSAGDAEPARGAADTPASGLVQLLLKRVVVLGVGSTSTTTTKTLNAEGEATVEEVPRTLLTVAVNQEDAERLMFAAADSNGTLSFALLTDDSKSVYKRGVGWNNLYYTS